MSNKTKVFIGLGGLAIVGILTALFVYKKKEEGDVVEEEIDICEEVEEDTVEEIIEEFNPQEVPVNLTPAQQKALEKAVEEINTWHPSYEYLIDDILVEMYGFTREDAETALNCHIVDWDAQAAMNAKVQKNNGANRKEIINWLVFCKFDDAQILKALKAIGENLE